MKPSALALWLTGLWVAIGVAVAYAEPYHAIWNYYGALLFLAAIVDAGLAWKRPALQFERSINHNLPVSTWNNVTLSARNPGRVHVEGLLYDHHPASFEVDALPIPVLLPAQSGGVYHYRVKTLQRGDAQFVGLDLLAVSRLRLWHRKHHFPVATAVRIYPDFAEISHYALFAIDNHLSQLGIRRRQRRGQGSSFYQLREYRLGDALKQIDWKATARHRKLISKEYQDERDQHVIFLLDCGRRMRHRDQQRIHLDQALNAMLLLSYVAIQQGDSVGFMSFAGEQRWFPPRKGAGTVNLLLQRTYDLRSTTDVADYVSVARSVLSLQRRRSMIILLTNTRDQDDRDLRAALRLLTRRHLVVLADLREEILHDVLDGEVHNMTQALRFHAVSRYLADRRERHETLSHRGALVLDTLSRDLPVLLVNQYLEIKRAARL